MQIGELSKLTGFTRDTIRWYEKIGLIQVDKNSRYENNYRNYEFGLVEKLILIKQIKSFGFTLNEIKEFMLLQQHDQLNCNAASKIFDNRLRAIEEKILELKNFRAKLLQVKRDCEGDCIEKIKTNAST